MLRERVITGVILVVLVVGAIIVLPTFGFGLLLLAVMLLGAWEWAGLLGIGAPGRVGYCILVAVMIALLWWLDSERHLLWAILLATGLYWCYVLFWLGRFTARPNAKDSRLVLQLAGLVVLVAPWIALTALHSNPKFGTAYVLFLMALIWVADSGAYFAGRRWGRRKLAPQISPGKTREGVLGALVVTLVLALLGASLLDLVPSQWPLFVAVCVVTVAFSIVGDLFESMVKRQHGVKDSGALLPGHGGILDRVDSLTAAAPLFLLGLQMLTR